MQALCMRLCFAAPGSSSGLFSVRCSRQSTAPLRAPEMSIVPSGTLNLSPPTLTKISQRTCQYGTQTKLTWLAVSPAHPYAASRGTRESLQACDHPRAACDGSPRRCPALLYHFYTPSFLQATLFAAPVAPATILFSTTPCRRQPFISCFCCCRTGPCVRLLHGLCHGTR